MSTGGCESLCCADKMNYQLKTGRDKWNSTHIACSKHCFLEQGIYSCRGRRALMIPPLFQTVLHSVAAHLRRAWRHLDGWGGAVSRKEKRKLNVQHWKMCAKWMMSATAL